MLSHTPLQFPVKPVAHKPTERIGLWARVKASLRARLQAWLMRKLAARMAQQGTMGASLPMRSQVTLGGKARVLNSYNTSRVAVSRALQSARK